MDPDLPYDFLPDMTPRDPSKPLTRATRRVLRFLLMGGRMQRQRRVLPGRKVRIEDPDPRQHYWILIPSKPRLIEGTNNYFRPGRKEYRLTRELVGGLVAKGYLRGISEGEATEENVTQKGRDVVARTDWNGNWLPGRKP